MQLMMYIGNDMIESVPVDSLRLSIPGYLGSFKRQLKQKHQALLQETPEQPEFLVVNLAPVTPQVAASVMQNSTAVTAGVYR
jgi:hypothetical protein